MTFITVVHRMTIIITFEHTNANPCRFPAIYRHKSQPNQDMGGFLLINKMEWFFLYKCVILPEKTVKIIWKEPQERQRLHGNKSDLTQNHGQPPQCIMMMTEFGQTVCRNCWKSPMFYQNAFSSIPTGFLDYDN